MINLKSLIKAAPFDEETRKIILDKLDKNELDENQKFQFNNLCWDMITNLYETELQMKIEGMMTEVAEGTKNYTQKDYQDLKDGMVRDLSAKFESETTSDAIEEVKKRLETYSTSPKQPTP